MSQIQLQIQFQGQPIDLKKSLNKENLK